MENNQKNINQVLENIVYFEMLRRGYNVKIGKVDNLEVDFVCKKNDETIYIQVSYLLASEDTKEREFSVLENIKDNYPKYVLSMDEFDMSRNGIKHINLIEFLVKIPRLLPAKPMYLKACGQNVPHANRCYIVKN